MRAMTGKSRSRATATRKPRTRLRAPGPRRERERSACGAVRPTRYRRDVPKAFRVLGERDFALLWGGQTASIIGDGVFTVALALETLRVSDHASTLSYVIAARVAPTVLLLLVAGADRRPAAAAVHRPRRRFGARPRHRRDRRPRRRPRARASRTSSPSRPSSARPTPSSSPPTSAIIPEILPSTLYMEGNAFNSASQVLGGSRSSARRSAACSSRPSARRQPSPSTRRASSSAPPVCARCAHGPHRRPRASRCSPTRAPGFAGRGRSPGCGTRSSPPRSPTSRRSRPSPVLGPTAHPRHPPPGSDAVRAGVRRRRDRRGDRLGRRHPVRVTPAARERHVGRLGDRRRRRSRRSASRRTCSSSPPSAPSPSASSSTAG